MRNRHRVRAAFGQTGLGWVIGRIKIDIGQIANQPVWPAILPHTGLFARHEFQRPMHAEMQHDIGIKAGFDPGVKAGKGMGGRKAFFKQQAHRVALVAKGGLHPDKDIAKFRAQHKHAPAIRLHPPRRRAPSRLDLVQPGGVGHDIIGADMGCHIRLLAIFCGIAF